MCLESIYLRYFDLKTKNNLIRYHSHPKQCSQYSEQMMEVVIPVADLERPQNSAACFDFIYEVT